jgi:ATP-dependent DNA helicase PIF1
MSEKVNSNFTDEQCKVFSLYSSGFSFFLTGEGGTGKSFVLKEIIQHAGRKLGNEDIAVTAPTGIAANNIGGQTSQSWAGIGLGKGTRYQLLDKVLANEECSARWKKCQLLIVDEVSLLNLYLFEKLEFIARRLRKTDAVFGGIQVIFSGDFFQIPPVSE